MHKIEKIAIFGAGQMGSGIAQVAARHGLQVLVCDTFPAALAKSKEGIFKNYQKEHAQMMEAKTGQNPTESFDPKAIFDRIDFVEGFPDHLDQVDFAVEAITENLSAKKALYTIVEPKLKSEAILATNTSSLSITKLGKDLKVPQRFIGMHFMNPVPRMQLIEVITGIQTSPATLETTYNLASALKKTTATSKDYPGFILNRILLPMLNEACYALFEGVGDIVSIDTSMKLGANHPMGPFVLLDFIGLDTALAIMEILFEGFGDPKYRPCPLLRSLVDAGWLGKKSGKGFYDYSTTPAKPSF